MGEQETVVVARGDIDIEASCGKVNGNNNLSEAHLPSGSSAEWRRRPAGRPARLRSNFASSSSCLPSPNGQAPESGLPLSLILIGRGPCGFSLPKGS